MISRIFWRPGFFQNKAQRLGQRLFFSRNDHFWSVVIWRVFFSLDMVFIQIFLVICVHWQRADRRMIFLTERENEKHGSLHSSVVNSVSNRALHQGLFSLRVKICWGCSPWVSICLFVEMDAEIVLTNHVGARHCQKPLNRRKGLNIFNTAKFTKIRAIVWSAQILVKYF